MNSPLELPVKSVTAIHQTVKSQTHFRDRLANKQDKTTTKAKKASYCPDQMTLCSFMGWINVPFFKSVSFQYFVTEFVRFLDKPQVPQI